MTNDKKNDYRHRSIATSFDALLHNAYADSLINVSSQKNEWIWNDLRV